MRTTRCCARRQRAGRGPIGPSARPSWPEASRRARGQDGGADGQPRRDRLRGRRRQGGRIVAAPEWACDVYWRAAQIGTPRALDADRSKTWSSRDRALARNDPTAGGRTKAIALGVHVLDVLVRPVERIPEGQGGELVEEIKITTAGSAGGTALTLAKLAPTVGYRSASARTRSATCFCGCWRTAASTPRSCCAATACRPRPPCCRSAERRPPGAARDRGERRLRRRRRPARRDRRADYLHFGGPEFMGGEAAAQVLEHARDNGVSPRPTCWRPATPACSSGWPAPSPTSTGSSQRRPGAGLHRRGRPRAGCRALVDRGAGCVATRGADGVLIVDADGSERVPAFQVDVVDTTGCGDSFVAGFLRGWVAGRGSPGRRGAGQRAAALVAQGFGQRRGRLRPRARRRVRPGDAYRRLTAAGP